jgi:hypothetical protein
VGRWREQQRREHDALQARAHRLRERAAPRAGIDRVDEFPVTVTPSFRGAVVRLPRWRRRALYDHVTRIVAASDGVVARAAPVAAEWVAGDAAGDAMARACTSCRGHCCRTGGEHAYLAVDTVARYRAARPETRADDTVDAYMSHVPADTRRGSCIYHGRTGCALPREMRSDTCNRFLCDALHGFDARVRSGAAPRAFFAAAHDGAIEAAAFVDGEQARLVRLTRRIREVAPERDAGGTARTARVASGAG